MNMINMTISMTCSDIFLITSIKMAVKSNITRTISLMFTILSCCYAVEIGVYYESYCPASREFLFGQLGPVYQMIPHLSIRLVPYGEATKTMNVDGQVEFKCRHGENECLANLIQGCAIKNYPNDQSLPFIACCSDDLGDPVKEAPKCAAQSGINWEELYNCSQSPNGIKIADEMRVATQDIFKLYYPWITIDQVHRYISDVSIRSDFLSYICSILKDEEFPNVCKTKQ
ncbi:hypothetical protein CHUAL_006409 [Chamberlinius hualienensis]